MSKPRLFKRKVESFGPVSAGVSQTTPDAGDEPVTPEEFLTAFAELTPAQKKTVLAGLPSPVRKALRNLHLLSQATADVPVAEEGIFATIQRTDRRVITRW